MRRASTIGPLAASLTISPRIPVVSPEKPLSSARCGGCHGCARPSQALGGKAEGSRDRPSCRLMCAADRRSRLIVACAEAGLFQTGGHDGRTGVWSIRAYAGGSADPAATGGDGRAGQPGAQCRAGCAGGERGEEEVVQEGLHREVRRRHGRPGTCLETISIEKNVTVTGAGINATIVDGGGKDAVIGIQDDQAAVIMRDMTLTNGSAGGVGGGVANGKARTTRINLLLTNQRAGLRGGGPDVNLGGEVTITNGTFSNNHAGQNGGGISDTGKVFCNGSTFSGNTRGGGSGKQLRRCDPQYRLRHLPGLTRYAARAPAAHRWCVGWRVPRTPCAGVWLSLTPAPVSS